MNAHYKLKIIVTLVVVGTLAGCASGKSAFKNGNHAELTRDYETAMAEYKKAMDADPANTEYRLKYEQNRFANAYAHFQKGKLAMELGNLESARTEFARAMEIDPSHDFAAQELARVNDLIAGRKPGAPVTPAPDFELSRLVLQPGQPYASTVQGVDIFFVLQGKVDVMGGSATLALEQGARTRDIADPGVPALGTREMGERIAGLIAQDSHAERVGPVKHNAKALG
jgi:tetratricopeptide (TPR) repeat protein